MSTRRVMYGFVAAAAVMSMTMPMAAQQEPAPAAKPAAKAKYAVPKTPWGDPHIAGVFTNNGESGIPLERPNQFEGKQLEDVSEGELQQLRDQRETQRVAAAPNLGGIPGTNPVHWFENFGAGNQQLGIRDRPAMMRRGTV